MPNTQDTTLIELIYNGVAREFETDGHATVKSLLDKAIHSFGITTNMHVLSLYDTAGIELNDRMNIRESGITAHCRLLLRPSQVKGGTAA